jgi:hypothetical protein
MAKNVREEFERWGKTTLNKVISKAPEREPSFKTNSELQGEVNMAKNVREEFER